MQKTFQRVLVHPAVDSAPYRLSETLHLKHNILGKTILELLKKAFDDKQRQQLGIDIHITADGWFKTGHIEFKVHTSSDIKSARTHNRLPRFEYKLTQNNILLKKINVD